MNRSTPGLPVHHHLPEFTQTHVHRVGDAIQPSHPLSSPSPPAPNPSQHQSFPMRQLFAWVGQSTGVSTLASFLPKNTQDWSPLEWTGWISLQFKGLSKESSPIPQFKIIHIPYLSLLSHLIPMCDWMCLVAQLCPTLCDPMDCSPSGSSIRGVFQPRILEWVAIASSRGFSWPRDEPMSPLSPALQADSLLTEPSGKPHFIPKFHSIWLCLDHNGDNTKRGFTLRSLIAESYGISV